MKKKYLSPDCREITIKVENHLCQESIRTGTPGEYQDNEIGAKEDNDDLGW